MSKFNLCLKLFPDMAFLFHIIYVNVRNNRYPKRDFSIPVHTLTSHCSRWVSGLAWVCIVREGFEEESEARWLSWHTWVFSSLHVFLFSSSTYREHVYMNMWICEQSKAVGVVEWTKRLLSFLLFVCGCFYLPEMLQKRKVHVYSKWLHVTNLLLLHRIKHDEINFIVTLIVTCMQSVTPVTSGFLGSPVKQWTLLQENWIILLNNG